MSTMTFTEHQKEADHVHLGTCPVRIKGILAATDFSKQATLALKIAARLAKQLRSRFYILHAIMPQAYAPGAGMLSPVLHEVDTKQAEEQLHRYTVKIPEVRTTKHEELVLNGPPTAAMRYLAEDKGIDFVVVGSHGRAHLGKFIFGSEAEAAIRHLPCPVLVVGPHCGRRRGQLKSLVLATDLPAGSLRAAQYAMSIAQTTGSIATLVHVLPTRVVAEDSLLEAEKESAIKELRHLVPSDTELRKHVHFKIAVGDPAEQIVQIAIHAKAGLIVMGVREHGVLSDHAPWATLSAVIRGAHCPVLAVRPHLL